MSKTRGGAIPPVPHGVAPDLRVFLENMRENVEIQLGRRGKKLDKAVTFRDLGTTDVQKLLYGIGAGSGSSGTGSSPSEPPTIDDATAPTTFQAFPGFDFILLQWDIPTYSGHGFTEINRITVDTEQIQTFTVANSSLIGTSSNFVYRDTVAEGSSHYYWARHVNTNDEPGPWHAVPGLYVSTAETFDSLVADAVEDILNAVNLWQNDISTALDILDDNVLQAILDSATTTQTIGNSIISTEGRLTSEIENAKTTAASDFGTATLNTETLKSLIYTQDINGDYLLDGEGNPIFSGAFIDRVDSTLATVDGELKASVGETVRVVDSEGNNYSLSDIMQVSLDNQNKFDAQWGIKLNFNELEYGVGLVRDSQSGEVTFSVATDNFTVYNPATGASSPAFVIDNQNRTLISDAYIDYASIADLVAGSVVASDIAVGVSLTSPIINGGEIIGGSLNINNKTRIESSGLLTATDASIEGTINASAGVMDSVIVQRANINDCTINETCDVLGTVYAQNIEGDIVDRTVATLEVSVSVSSSTINNTGYTIVSGSIIPGTVGPTSIRILQISELKIIADRPQGGDGSVTVGLLFDGTLIQQRTFTLKRFYPSIDDPNPTEEVDIVLRPFACNIPVGNTTHTFEVKILSSLVLPSVKVGPFASIIDIFKAGTSLTNLSGSSNNITFLGK
jgi:predicted phage tail protein